MKSKKFLILLVAIAMVISMTPYGALTAIAEDSLGVAEAEQQQVQEQPQVAQEGSEVQEPAQPEEEIKEEASSATSADTEDGEEAQEEEQKVDSKDPAVLPIETPAAEEPKASEDSTEKTATASATEKKVTRKAAKAGPGSEIKATYGDPRDFEKYIKSVKVFRMGSTQNTWSEVTDDNPVKTGDDVNFELKFELPGNFLKYRMSGDDRTKQATNTITYDISPPIGSIKEEHDFLYDDAGNRVAEYWITPKDGENPSGIITINLSERYVERNNQGGRIESKVEFTSSVDGWDDKEDGVVDVPIGGDAGKIEIIIQPEDAVGDIKIKKGTTSFKSTTGEIGYTMDVTSNSGTKTNVTVTDTMVHEVIKGNGNFKVTKTHEITVTDPETGEESKQSVTTPWTWLSLKNEKGQTAFNDSDGNHDSGFEMVLLPLGPGEKYTITYDAYYPKMVNGSVSVKNTAIAKSTDEEDKLLISTSSVSNTLSNTPVSKTGKLIEVTDDQSGETTYLIEWTVKINPNKVDIGKWALSDTGLYNYREGSEDPADDLAKKYLNAQDLELIPLKDNGDEDTDNKITLPNVVLDGNNTIYTFADGETRAFVLKYKTKMDFDDDYYEAKNTIKMNPPQGDQDNEENDSSSTTPGIKGIDTEKDHDDIEVDLSQDPPTAKINWKMELDAKASGIPAGSIFADTLGEKQKFDDIDALKAAIEAAFQPYGGVTWEKVKVNGQDEDSPTDTQFAFKLKQAIPQGENVKFEYKTVIQDFDPKSQATYSNSATLKNPAGETIGNPTDKVVYKPAIKKYDESTGSSKTTKETTHYVGDKAVTYNGNKQTIKWGFDVNLPASYYGDGTDVKYVVISDELPSGVTPARFAFGTTNFENIKDATESNPAVWEQTLGDLLAVKADVDSGYAKEVGEKISDGGTFSMEAWFDASEGPNGAVKVKIPIETIKYYKFKTYEFKLYAEIPEDFNWGKNDRDIKEHTFENNVYLSVDYGEGPEPVLDATHTQTILNDENARAVIKSNIYDANEDNRTVPYRVVVNEEGKDLLPGVDTISFKDSLKAEYPWGVSVTLVPGSFKVYEIKDVQYESDGKTFKDATRVKDLTDSINFVHEPGKISGDEWTISADLPDGKMLLVEYSYRMSGYTTGRERVKLHNTSEITGVATDSNNGEMADEIQVQESRGIMNLVEMTLAKVDSENSNKLLEGAKFQLYFYDGKQYVEASTLTTGKDGELHVDDSVFSKGIQFDYNTAYRLVEIEAPLGYKLDTTPTDFIMTHRDYPITDIAEEEYIPNNFDGYYLGLANATIYFKNVEDQPLTLFKNNDKNKPLAGAKFSLYKAASSGVSIPYANGKTGELLGDDFVTDEKGEVMIRDLPSGDYYIVETEAPEGGYVAEKKAIHFKYDGNGKYEFDSYEDATYSHKDDVYKLDVKNYKPKLKIKKIALTKKADPGEEVEYEITVKNTGKVTAYDATIIDTLGDGLKYVSDNRNGTQKKQEITWTRDIKPGQEIKIKLKAMIRLDADQKKVTNKARVTYNGAGEENSSNSLANIKVNTGNTNDDDDDSGIDGKPDKSGRVIGTGDLTNIALWVVLAAAAIAALGIVAYRRRRG